ncbi:alkaline phosphatase family protein [Mesorhizobium sp. PL10]
MRRVVVVILDGLRRDFVVEKYMPRLASFSRMAETVDGYKSIAPSVTRVCSSTFTTGCFPAQHGVEGNSFSLMENGRFKIFDTGRPDFFDHKRRITGSRLNKRGLAELVEDHGGSIVYSNVSPGAAYAHDPDGHGVVHHRAGSFDKGRPVTTERQLKIDWTLEGDRKMTELFIADALSSHRPALALLWLGHPDSTQHEVALGSPEHIAALKECDRLAGQVIDRVVELRQQGDDTLLIIGSDHGHQTVRDVIDVEQKVAELGFSAALEKGDVVIVPNGTSALIYATEAGHSMISDLSSSLRGQAWVGNIFEAHQLQSLGHTSARGLALFVSMAADDDVNEFGVPGRSFAARPLFDKPDRLGCGQHGGLGRYEQSPVLMIEGDGFVAGALNSRPSSLVDLAPTILKHLNLPAEGMDGSSMQHSSTSQNAALASIEA